jgi:type VI protein secretion system component Hcp
MPVVMELPGIRGGTEYLGYETWMPLTGFGWGGTRAIRKQVGPTGRMGAFVLAPQLKAVTARRMADFASPEIWDRMMNLGRKDVQFVWLRTSPGGDGLQAYLRLTLFNALITKVAQVALSAQPEEAIEFSYDKVEVRVVNVGSSLTGPQDVVSYSLPDAVRG